MSSDILARENCQLVRINESLWNEKLSIKKEHDKLIHINNKILRENRALLNDNSRLVAENARLLKKIDELTKKLKQQYIL